MKGIKIFKNEKFGQVRIAYNEYDEPLFCLADVCKSLGLDNSSEVKKRLSQKGLRNVETLTKGGKQSLTYIDEGNLYRCVLRSRKPQAEEFQEWICYDVIPSIRKHGGYMTPDKIEEILTNPDTLIKLATSLKEEQHKRRQAEARVSYLKPKAELMDKILDSDQKIDIGQTAKILSLPFGRNTLFAKLREKGVFFTNRNEPKQEFINRGYFELKEKWIERDQHDGFAVIKVLVTQRGLDFVARLFGVVNHRVNNMEFE